MELNKIYNEDCLIGMKKIPDASVDCIICDLPYGTTVCKWDSIIPFDKLWEQYDRIIKDNGAVLLFGQEPFSSFVRMSNLKNYKYDIYWQKERITNIQQVKRRVGKNVETISIFYKKTIKYTTHQSLSSNWSPRKNWTSQRVCGSIFIWTIAPTNLPRMGI